jgi:putative transposase
MDGSREQPVMTAGLDLGDKYSYLCLIDTQSGEIMEEGRLRTTPDALRRRFCSERSLRIAIETGTHSPWMSRVLEECDHEGIKAAVAGELPGTEWQRCAVHFQRNVLSHVPASSMSEVAEDLSAIFKVRRVKTAEVLVKEFVSL